MWNIFRKRVYHNGYDWIIATSAKEANEISIKDYGADEEQKEDEWVRLPNTKILKIGDDEMPKKLPLFGKLEYSYGSRGGFPFWVSAPCWAWILFSKEPFLCTTEY